MTLNPVKISPWFLFLFPVPRKVCFGHPVSMSPSLEHPEFFWGNSLPSLCACDFGRTVITGSSPPATKTLSGPEHLLVGPSVSREWAHDEWAQCFFLGLWHLSQWCKFEDRLEFTSSSGSNPTRLLLLWTIPGIPASSFWSCLNSKTNFLVFPMIFFPLSQPKSVPATCNQRTLTDSHFRWSFLPCLMTTYNNSQSPVLIPDKMLKHLHGWNYLGRIIAQKVFIFLPQN